jgi:hypothetical protein
LYRLVSSATALPEAPIHGAGNAGLNVKLALLILLTGRSPPLTRSSNTQKTQKDCPFGQSFRF